MGHIHKVSRQIVCRANRLERLSTRIRKSGMVVVDVGSLNDLYGRKIGQSCSDIALGSSLGAPQKRIHGNLSWSPQEWRVFDETFADRLWSSRLVRYVEDSLNSACLLAFTTLRLMPACTSNGRSPFHLQKNPQQVKGRPCAPRALRRGSVDVDRVVVRSNHRLRRFYQIT